MKFRCTLVISLIAIVYIAAEVHARKMPAFAGHASQQARKPADKKAPASEQEALKAMYKEQAVQVLKDALNSSSLIEDIGQRSILVARAAELLWPYDRELASTSICTTVDHLLDQYKEPTVRNSSEKLGRLNAAINRLMKTLARRDAVLAASVQQHITKTKQEALKDTAADPSAKERMSLAQESLASDTSRSVELAARALQNGVPMGFPQYMYDLEQIDPAGANALFNRALNRLGAAQAYSATDAIQLSTYAFTERMMLLPVPDMDEGSQKLQFGVFTKSLSSTKFSLKPSLANAYLSAGYQYVNNQLHPGSLRGADPIHLVQSLFLATKLSAYSSRLGLSQGSAWQQLKIDLEVRCRNAGVDDATLQNMNGFALRLANADDVFQFGDDSLFDNAKDIKDQRRRNQVLVRGIWNLIQSKRYQEAEIRIKDVDDRDIKEKLADVFEYYAAKADLKELDMIEFTRRSRRIIDPRVRLMLFLDAARVSERNAANQFLLDARNLIPRITGKSEKAKGLISVASLSAATDPQLSREVLSEVAKAINAADDFEGGDFQMEVAIMPDFRIMLSLPDSSLDTCLKRAAQIDWRHTLSLTEDLNSKELRALARISTCAAVL